MKNHIFLTLFFLILRFSVSSQFMQNGGFEQYNNLYGGEDLNRADYWHTMLNSPDLKHSQLTNQNYANTGNGCAYLGLNTVGNSEYCYGTTLSLNANNKYILTFFVKIGNSLVNNSIPIGIKIVKNEPISNPYGYTDYSIVQNFVNNPNNSPDFTYKPVGVGYEKVTYCFTPSESGIHYVIFGPFLSQTPPLFEVNHFLIDDVDISLATNNQINLDSNPVLISTALCTQNTILVDGTSSQFENEYQWEIFQINNNITSLVYSGSIQQGTASIFNVSDAFSSVGHIPLPNSCYRVILRVLNGCTDIDQLDFCYEDVNVDFLNVPAAVCEGTPTNITVTGDDNWTYTWSNGFSGVGAKTTSVTPVYPTSQFTVTVTSPSGCSQVNSVTLNVHSSNNLAPWMNGIQNLSNGTLGNDPFTVYVQQGQIVSFNSQLFNDNSNEIISTILISSTIPNSITQTIPPSDGNNQTLSFYWNTGQGFAPNASPGVYEFTLNSNDGNQCVLGEDNFIFKIIIFCDQCPTCVSFENRIPSNSPLPPETKVGVCIEAGLSQPVQTGNATVLFQAGASITLGEFFQAGPGFQAIIEPTTCVTDCEDCCNDFTGFTYDEIPNGVYMNFSDNDPTNDIFQVTDINHPFCAFGAKGFELYIYSTFGSGTIYELTSHTTICCAYQSPAPENQITHSSIYWNGYVNNIFGNQVHALDGNYTYQLRLYGCNGAYEEKHGIIHILSSSGLITLPNNEFTESQKSQITSSVDEVNKLSETISLAPNPASNEIQILGFQEGKKVKVQLFDSKGFMIEKDLQIKNNIFDVSKLSPGTYYCKMIINGNLVTKSFVKI